MIGAFLAVSAVGGCSHGPALTPRTQLQVLTQQELPTPNLQDLVQPSRNFVIGPYDKLSIDVYGTEDLKRERIEVDGSGQVQFPFAGTLQAGGKTPKELAEVITARISKYVRDPQVTVNLIEATSSAITVDGQVKKPGLYPVIGRMTLNRSIASAEGLSEFAKIEEVVVFRTVGGKDYAALYDLDAIRRGAYADPEIFANDIIVVGDSPSRRFMKDLVTIAPTIVAPIVTILAR